MLEVLNRIGKDFLKKESNLNSFLLVYPKDSLLHTKDGRKKLTIKVFIDLSQTDKISIDFEEFKFNDITQYWIFDTQIWEPNDNNWMVASLASKVDALEKSIFKGDFLKAIKKYNLYSSENKFINVLEKLDLYKLPEGKLIKSIITTNKIKKKDFDELASVIIIFVKYDGKYLALSEIDGFEFIVNELNKRHFFEKNFYKGISYLSGKETDELTQPIFIRRVNVNKIFVMTTKNYASYFSDKNYIKNYALDNTERINLNAGSYYILNNTVVRIAEIDHFILPQVVSNLFEKENFDLLNNIEKFKRSSQLIFEYNALEKMEIGLEYELDENLPIWINYYGFETNGKSLKIINLIKDISPSRLHKIYSAIEIINNELNFGKKLNLYDVYLYIPIRGDRQKREIKDKVNIALKIFKNILENYFIDRELIFSLAQEVIQVYRYERFEAYINILYNNFDFGVANVIKIYLFFIQILKKLQLMENKEIQNPIPSNAEEEWFNKFDYTDEQKAMFYLGRLLEMIAYAQTKQGHTSKPVLNKLNYNGMDREAIIRLAEDLFEKIRQYARQLSISSAEYNYAMFNQFFNPNDWTMSPQEALFFILSGYSFVRINYSNIEKQKNN